MFLVAFKTEICNPIHVGTERRLILSDIEVACFDKRLQMLSHTTLGAEKMRKLAVDVPGERRAVSEEEFQQRAGVTRVTTFAFECPVNWSFVRRRCNGVCSAHARKGIGISERDSPINIRTQ